jgi:hypothetical protein
MTADSSPKAHELRVFVSYIREDEEIVARLAKELSAYGIKVWLDKTELKPGYRWKDAIREAISEGDFFIACFSEAYQRRSKSYMNEELTLAVEELRQRPTDRAWFIPVLLSECEVPARGIGAGETLRDIQWVELYRNWQEGLNKIAEAIDPYVQIAQQACAWQLDEHEWHYLMLSLERLDCVPILGRGINYGVIPPDEALTRRWAKELQRPEWIGLPLSQVAEHMAETDPRRGVQRVLYDAREEIKKARFSEVDTPGKAHAVLSQLPCDVFITACIDNFMEDALTSQGKKPRAVIIDWHDLAVVFLWKAGRTTEGDRRERRVINMHAFDSMISSEADFTPTVVEPWVLHVFGHLDEPLCFPTERDHTWILQTGGAAIYPAASRCIYRSDRSHMWLGFDPEGFEKRMMSSLLGNFLDRDSSQFFGRKFEMRAVREHRRRILLSEFMAELQSRWEEWSKHRDR